MTEKKRKLIETISGKGKVFRGENEIAEVNYTIEVFQEYLVTRTFTGESSIEGLKEIIGHLTVIKGEHNLITGEVLTLKLSDGRRWAFSAKTGDPVSSTYLAVNATGGGLVEDV